MGKKKEVVTIVPKRKKSTVKKVAKAAIAIAAVNGALKLYSMYKETKDQEQDNNKDNTVKRYNVYMKGRQIRLDGEAIQGIFIKTFMGGVDLDLRKAIITEDVFITCDSLMGGVSIRVPEHVNVSLDTKNILSGVSNTVPKHFEDEVCTIYIDGNNVMSGISVRTDSNEENSHKYYDVENASQAHYDEEEVGFEDAIESGLKEEKFTEEKSTEEKITDDKLTEE